MEGYIFKVPQARLITRIDLLAGSRGDNSEVPD